MKQILEQWSGKFAVDGEIDMDLHRLSVKDGDNFHVRLLSKRREVDDEDLLPTRRL